MSTEQEGGGADVPSAKTPPEGEEELSRLPPPQPSSVAPAAEHAGADAFGTVPPPPGEPPAPPAPPAAPPAPPTQPFVYGGQFPPPPAAPRKKGRGGLIALLAAVAVVAGGLGGVIGSSVEKSNSSSDSSTTVSSSTNPKALERSPNSVSGIAAKALPSVVTIEASGSQESGTGSGFVFDTQGHILTNNHVVAPALNGGKLTVKLADGSSYSASVVGRAAGYDVAVVKIDNPPKDKLKPLPLGNSNNVAVGDPTIAIGAPFGLSGTVTAGIVSAKNRPVASGDATGSQTSYMNALQTDASINPGNSGGPLLDGQGQVIGIDSAIQSTNSGGSSPFGASQQAGSIGLGFAIPINEAKRVAGELISTGQPVYPIIGVLRNDNYQGTGAQISPTPIQGTPAVTPGGPADKAGLKPGDVITKLDGVPIDSGPTLVSEIWSHVPGEKITLTYTRNGKSHTTTLTLGSRKGDA